MPLDRIRRVIWLGGPPPPIPSDWRRQRIVLGGPLAGRNEGDRVGRDFTFDPVKDQTDRDVGPHPALDESAAEYRDRPCQVWPRRDVDDLLDQATEDRLGASTVARRERREDRPIASRSDSADAAGSDARWIRSSIARSPTRILHGGMHFPAPYRASPARSRNIRRRGGIHRGGTETDQW
jgi:hypothetical protein